MRSFPDAGATAGKDAQRPRKRETLLGEQILFYF